MNNNYNKIPRLPMTIQPLNHCLRGVGQMVNAILEIQQRDRVLTTMPERVKIPNKWVYKSI